VFVSLVSGWLIYAYMPADAIRKISPIMGKYQTDWSGYVRMSLVGDLVYVLPTHVSYGLFKALLNKGRVWGAVLFVIYLISYFFILSVLTGIIVGYFEMPMKPQEAVSSVVVVWIYTLIFIAVRSYRQNRRRQRELESKQTQAELQALKAQVNPHFMFNTLNNLYGTALSGDSNRTAAGIEQLSSVMRHITEASQQDVIPVVQELRFVEDIIELHRMRLPYTDTVQIKTDIEWDDKPAQIVPLLLNPLIENAFKYGISVQHPCFVHIKLNVQDKVLNLKIENSVLTQSRLEKGTGVGLANVRQRLNLAYPKQHSFHFAEKEGVFTVDLTINL
jgi:sensor histidine kinase YesM